MQLFTVSRNPNGWPVVLFVYYFLPFCIQGETYTKNYLFTYLLTINQVRMIFFVDLFCGNKSSSKKKGCKAKM